MPSSPFPQCSCAWRECRPNTTILSSCKQSSGLLSKWGLSRVTMACGFGRASLFPGSSAAHGSQPSTGQRKPHSSQATNSACTSLQLIESTKSWEARMVTSGCSLGKDLCPEIVATRLTPPQRKSGSLSRGLWSSRAYESHSSSSVFPYTTWGLSMA